MISVLGMAKARRDREAAEEEAAEEELRARQRRIEAAAGPWHAHDYPDGGYFTHQHGPAGGVLHVHGGWQLNRPAVLLGVARRPPGPPYPGTEAPE